jgi:hypothetical protein
MADVAIPQGVLDAVRRRYVPAKPSPYLTDPAGWVRDRTHEFMWSKQIETFNALRDHRRVAVKAGHGVGKSWLGGRALAWWIDAHPTGDARGVTTAPSDHQVKGILWRELRTAHKLAGLAGRINLDAHWNIEDQEVAIGRKPADHQTDTRFQGIHERYLLAILDEAGGIPLDLWTAVDTLLTNDDSRLLALGNPDNPSTNFRTICAGAPEDGSSGMSDQGWWVITISVFDSPNFTGEPCPPEVLEKIVGPVWVAERRATWGEESPLWTSKVLGRFPTDATDGVVPYSWVTACRSSALPEISEPRELGFDPARDGEDRAACWLRIGSKAVRYWSWAYTPDPLQLANLVLPIIQDHDVQAVKIDADGLGWGMSGILDQWHLDGKHNATAIPVFGSKAADDEVHFMNKRAEMWWAARERSRLERWDLAELGDDDVAELCAPRYHTNNPRARIQIEKKAELKQRLGRSPDSADALILAFHEEHFEVASGIETMAAQSWR